jgi:citrate synthase
MDQAGSRIYRPRQVYVGPREQHYVAIEKRNKVS